MKFFVRLSIVIVTLCLFEFIKQISMSFPDILFWSRLFYKRIIYTFTSISKTALCEITGTRTVRLTLIVRL